MSSTFLSRDTGINNALEAAIDVRLERRKIYGDKFKESADWELLALIKEKTRRLEQLIIEDRQSNDYESKIDTLIDLINWSAFLLENQLSEVDKE